MTGRARGRARGRGEPAQARRPGEAPAEPSAHDPAPGRGRSRGGITQAQPPAPGRGGGAAAAAAAPAPAPAATSDMGDVSSQMANLSIGDPTRGGVGDDIIVPKTRSVQDKTGTIGSEISLTANFFRLNKSKDDDLYQYNVTFSPEIDSKILRIGLLHDYDDILGKTRAFDGMTLILPIKLADLTTELVSKRRSDGAAINITITLTNELPPTSPTCLHLYNIIFKKILRLIKMEQIGRNYYNPAQQIEVPAHKLELWPGFSSSILQYETNVMLCADVSHKVLRQDTVLELLYAMNAESSRDFYDHATKKLVGEIVLTRYNNRTYRIDGIDWDSRPHFKFQKRDGSEMTYMEYYEKAYEKKITDPHQPLLVSLPKKQDGKRGDVGPIHLIPEFCFLTGLTDEMRSDFNVMKDIAVHTRVSPEQRQTQLLKFIRDIHGDEAASKELTNWGLKFDERLLQFMGRILPPEKIYQKSKQSNYDPAEADWSRETRGNELISTVHLERWILLFTSRDQSIANDFYETLTRVCGPMGMNVTKPTMCELSEDRTETYLRTIKEQMNANTQMVVCIIPNNRKDRYDAIKQLCCIECPVPCQMVVSRTLSKKQMLMYVATKIGMQLNCKLGGALWALEIPLKNLMVVGIDCYQDSITKGQSVAAFVASTNQTLTRFYSRVTFQHTGQELIDGLKVCMQASLKKYNEVNKVLPERILIYRDSVGDGQLQAVVEHEIPQLLKCFEDIGPGYNPKVAVIVVKKQVNARFFHSPGQNLTNPPPGTIIDTKVTRPEWYDFYLVSQTVRQGTVTPTHYNVVYDTSGLRPDHIQRLTYTMTHLYYNWPCTIRVPAPCQYAHKLAFLVGQSLHKEPDLSLSDRLFFL
ncbi:piwi-like protein 1 [Glandiceps talaboti]